MPRERDKERKKRKGRRNGGGVGLEERWGRGMNEKGVG